MEFGMQNASVPLIFGTLPSCCATLVLVKSLQLGTLSVPCILQYTLQMPAYDKSIFDTVA